MSAIAEQVKLKEQIYAVNRQIRALPGNEPTPEWRKLMGKKNRLTNEYWQAGGSGFL